RACEPYQFAAVVCGNVIPFETELLKDTERWCVPLPDSRPEPFSPRRYRGIEHRASCLSRVATAMRTPQQLIRDLRLLDGRAADDQPAITDVVAFVTAPDGQQGDPRCRRCRELLCDKCPGVLSRRCPVTALGVKEAELIGVRLGPWLQPQPLGLKVAWHRLVRRHGPTVHHGSAAVCLRDQRIAATEFDSDLSPSRGRTVCWPGRRKLASSPRRRTARWRRASA